MMRLENAAIFNVMSEPSTAKQEKVGGAPRDLDRAKYQIEIVPRIISYNKQLVPA